jgi:hypothetical protein
VALLSGAFRESNHHALLPEQRGAVDLAVVRDRVGHEPCPSAESSTRRVVTALRLPITGRVGLTPSMEDCGMSIVVRFHPSNATKEKYDESLRRMEEAGIWPDPPGLELHVAFGAADDLRASEIWSSREQFEAYGEKLMPILADMGIEFSAEPEIFEVQNLVKR